MAVILPRALVDFFCFQRSKPGVRNRARQSLGFMAGNKVLEIDNIFGLDFPLGVQTLLVTLSLMRKIECAEMCRNAAHVLQLC